MLKKILIAIPAFNEGKNIESVLSNLTEYKKDIIVINDGSSDNTIDVIKNMGVNVISHTKNMGLSATYNSMVNYADNNGYTHLITFDGDGQHDTSYINKFIEMFDKFDFIAGNRFHSLDNIPAAKISSNFFAIMLTRLTFGVTLPDVACGFRAMKLDNETKNINSLHFGVVYEMLFNRLHLQKDVSFVNIPATYPKSTPLMTNTSEIFGLLGELIKYNSSSKLNQISRSLFMGEDFEIDIQGYIFKGKFINNSFYQFSTNIDKAKQFYRDNFITNN
jgi:glycosyltransferase involved in cell wall biosynthesis